MVFNCFCPCFSLVTRFEDCIYIRDAIQLAPPYVGKQRIYTRTGWQCEWSRKIPWSDTTPPFCVTVDRFARNGTFSFTTLAISPLLSLVLYFVSLMSRKRNSSSSPIGGSFSDRSNRQNAKEQSSEHNSPREDKCRGIFGSQQFPSFAIFLSTFH